MKKTIKCLFFSILLFAFILCTVVSCEKKPPTILLTVENEITTHSEEIHLKLTNHVGATIYTSHPFELQQRIDNDWVKIELQATAHAKKDQALRIEEDNSVIFKIPIIRNYGNYLQAGEYRILHRLDAVIRDCPSVIVDDAWYFVVKE